MHILRIKRSGKGLSMYLDSIVPFYVAYPNYRMYSDEYRRMQDLEYLQAMYPIKVKEYQRKINQVLDRIDYAGSMIYDEYPDRISLYKLAADITDSIIRDENIRGKTDENETDKMNKEHIGVIVQILLYYEIHKRRYKRSDSFLNF